MKTLIIFSHPSRNSFNGKILDTIIEELKLLGHEYKVRDLYKEGFNPVLDEDELQKSYSGILPLNIRQYQRDISWAENIILIFPIWWMAPPAILKGWIDRVFTVGFAYSYDKGGIKGLIKNKSMTLITTSGQSERNMKKSGMIEAMNRINLEGTMEYCGFRKNIHKNLYGVNKANNNEREDMLKEVLELIKGLR